MLVAVNARVRHGELVMKFRKKPVVIDAIQLTKKNLVEVHDLVHGVDSSTIYGMAIGFIEKEVEKYGGLPIPTLEDGKPSAGVKHVASFGDWIIKGVKGEFYPCKPDIFEATYESV